MIVKSNIPVMAVIIDKLRTYPWGLLERKKYKLCIERDIRPIIIRIFSIKELNVKDKLKSIIAKSKYKS